MSHKEFFAQQCGTYIRNVGIEKYKYVLKLFLNKVALFEELIKIVNTQKNNIYNHLPQSNAITNKGVKDK